MKRLMKSVAASNNVSTDQYTFTPADVIALLSQIEELSGVNISLEKTPDGMPEFVIGDSAYMI